MADIGKNVRVEVREGNAIVTINLKKNFGSSKSGKTIIIASTQGNKDIGGGVILGLNCYKYSEKE